MQFSRSQLGRGGAILVLVFAVFAVTLDVHANETRDYYGARELLKRVCKQTGAQSDTPRFTSPKEAAEVVAEYARQLGEPETERACESSYDASFQELGALLEPQILADICSPRMYELVRAYHVKFIHFYLPETSRNKMLVEKETFEAQPIPLALRDFFILFVKQIGATCKRRLAEHLEETLARMEAKVDEVDFAAVGQHKCKEGSHSATVQPFSKEWLSSLFKAHKLNQLEIGHSLEAQSSEIVNEADDLASKLYVQVRPDNPLVSVKMACERRFEPIYMDVFAPIVKLNNLGYTQRSGMKTFDRKLNKNACIRRWFHIIETCEALKYVEVVYDPFASQQEPQVEKIVSFEEARKLRQLMDAQGAEGPAYSPDRVEFEYEKLALGNIMMLTGEKEAENELKALDRDIERSVSRRTRKAVTLRSEFLQYLNGFMHKKGSVREVPTSIKTRLTDIYERHPTLIVGTAITLVFLLVVSGALSVLVVIG